MTVAPIDDPLWLQLWLQLGPLVRWSCPESWRELLGRGIIGEIGLGDCLLSARREQALGRGPQGSVGARRCPLAMQSAVIGFLEQGRNNGSLRFSGSARDTAHMIMSCLEAAMLVARRYGGIERFQAAAENMLAGLTRAAPQPAGLASEPLDSQTYQ